MTFGLLALLLLLLAHLGVTLLTIRRKQERVRAALLKQGARNVRISWKMFKTGRGFHTYAVEYEDAHGRRQRKTCMVFGAGTNLFWQDEA